MIAHIALGFFLGVLLAALLMFLLSPAPPGLLGAQKPDDLND